MKAAMSSAGHRCCAVCRAPFGVNLSLKDIPEAPEVAGAVRKKLGDQAYHDRMQACDQELEKLQRSLEVALPVFHVSAEENMAAGMGETLNESPIGLVANLGNVRSLELRMPYMSEWAHTAWDGLRLFVHCKCSPRQGLDGELVSLDVITPLGGTTFISGRSLQSVVLGQTWLAPTDVGQDGGLAPAGSLCHTRVAIADVERALGTTLAERVVSGGASASQAETSRRRDARSFWRASRSVWPASRGRRLASRAPSQWLGSQ